MALGLGSGMVFSSRFDKLLYSYQDSFSSGGLDSWEMNSIPEGEATLENVGSSGSEALKLTYSATQTDLSGIVRNHSLTDRKAGDYWTISARVICNGTWNGSDDVRTFFTFAGKSAYVEVPVGTSYTTVTLSATATDDDYATTSSVYWSLVPSDAPQDGDIFYIRAIDLKLYRPFGN